MADIFISYSSHDRLHALALVEHLRGSGYDVWIDQHQIHGANRWGREIANAINDAKLFLVLISASSLSSVNVVKELNLAAEKQKQMLPVMIESLEFTEEFAYHLSGLQRCGINNIESILAAIHQLNIQRGGSTKASPAQLHAPASKDIRLAILPFNDLSKDHDNEWFADGMLDELITTLGALEHVKVPSRMDVLYYKDHRSKAQDVARDLNVRYIVGGGVRKAGNKIRITASMTDAFTNEQAWTNQYDGNFDDIFDLQERISKQIAAALELKLTPAEMKIIAEKPTSNAEAYELYLRGGEFHKLETRMGYDNALKLYKDAVALDPHFVDAYLDIANTYATYYKECSRDVKWLDLAEENLRSAETLSGETYRTLWIRGELAWHRGDYQGSEQFLLQASKLNPNFEPAFNILGHLYLKTGRFGDAVQAFERVVSLRRNHETYFNFLLALSIVQDTSRLRAIAIDALPIIQKHTQRNPDQFFWRVSFGYILHWADRKEDALKEANQLSAREDLDGFTLYNLGALFDELGQPEQNLILFRDSIKKGFRDIDQFRNYSFTCGGEQHRAELRTIIQELDDIIQNEVA